MKSSVVIRRNGGFYYAFDNDALVISYLTGYKVSSGRCGFPLNSLNKVTNLLEESKVNYVVKENMKEVESKNYKKNNKYNKVLDKGKKKYDIDYRINKLQENLHNLSYDKLCKLLDIIEDYIDE